MPDVVITHGESRTRGTSPYAVMRTGRRPYPRADGVTALTIYLVALCAVPARLVVGPLAGLGAPSTLGALMLAGWWIWYQVSRTEPGTCSQPVRLGYFVCLGAFLASYAVAMLRPIDSSEFSTAQIGMIGLVGWGGILLVANDGVPNLARYVTLCRRIAFTGGALATLGVMQFLTGQQIVDRVKIPGLVANGALVALGSREGFNRPSATALHPIEFGAVITMILPIAIALALTDTGRSALRRWTPVAAIALAIPLSISRSALLSSLVALLVLGVAWTPKVRAKAAGAVVVLMGVVFVMAPGVLASLSRLFLSIGNTDTSAQSRTDSYGMAGEYIANSPLLGRGFATFLPSYRILDNQLLGLLIEVGVIGLFAFLGMIAVGVWCGVRTRKRSTDPVAAQLGQACAAALCAGVVSMALFDGLAFPMSGCMLFLLIGVTGAGWRIARQPATATPPMTVPAESRR